MLNFKEKQICLVLAGSILLSSCAITKGANKSISETDANVTEANKQLESTVSIKRNNFVEHSDTVYFGGGITPLNNANLPSVFNNPVQIDKTFVTMNQISDTLNKLTGISVLVQRDVGQDLSRPIRISQNYGSITDLLDTISSKADIGWTYQGGQILLQQTETKTWTIKNIPGNLQLQNQINNSSGISGQGSGQAGSASNTGQSGGGGGQSSTQSTSSSEASTVQNVQFNYNGDYWKSLDVAIKKQISKQGSYSINDQTSSITVNDKPSVIAKINQYIEKQNALMARQVVIDVQVLSVETDGTDNYGINWNIALKGANASFTMNGQAAQGTSGTFTPSPVFLPTAATQAFTVTANSGDLSGSQLIVNALSSMTRVSNVVATAAVTLSNQPVPINFTDQVSYLASTQTTISGQSSLSQVALTPGQLTVGFSMNILPVIEDDGTVRLQTSVSISNLKAMAQYSSGGSSIQLPTVGNRSFMQKTAIRNGDTFVVTGFDGDINTLIQDGVGVASNWIFVVGTSAQKVKHRLVILLTPRIVKS